MSKKVLFISHDANRAGSQLLLLQLLRLLKKKGVPMHLLLCDGGSIESEFREVVPTTVVPGSQDVLLGARIDKVLSRAGIFRRLKQQKQRKKQQQFEAELKGLDIGLVFVNSIANAELYHRQLTFLHHLPVVLFAHELQMSAEMYTERPDLSFLIQKTNHLIAVSHAVSSYYTREFAFPEEEVSTFTLIDHEAIDKCLKVADHHLLETQYNIPRDAIVIGGCGNAELRKGNDIFNWIARIVLQKTAPLPVYFVWVGAGPEHEIYNLLISDIQRMELQDKIILIPPTPNALDLISRFDLLLLTSREDPYPLVVLEAALNETPIVCFDKAGGAPELVEHNAGFVVPYMDISAASEAVIQLIVDPAQRQAMGRKAREKVLKRHDTRTSVKKVLSILQRYLTLPLSETHDQ
ncbi:glycosyltransferase family 4 protein [Telluribacter sp. SYSU D00476]|uniref:glycosyltransferase family 4 protein n=1 Tax=Telluribacter sp. SYSU D00476 TaxID=2811430 RepID=UPI001FF51509|nr:glycosyltransferase family 4 protein [Telluribacter sp. SYSU D00476]